MGTTTTAKPIDRPYTVKQCLSAIGRPSVRYGTNEVAIRTGFVTDGRFIVQTSKPVTADDIPPGHEPPDEDQLNYWMKQVTSYYEPTGKQIPLTRTGERLSWQNSDGKRPTRIILLSGDDDQTAAIDNRNLLTCAKLAGVRLEDIEFRLVKTAAPENVVALFDGSKRQFAVIAPMDIE